MRIHNSLFEDDNDLNTKPELYLETKDRLKPEITEDSIKKRIEDGNFKETLELLIGSDSNINSDDVIYNLYLISLSFIITDIMLANGKIQEVKESYEKIKTYVNSIFKTDLFNGLLNQNNLMAYNIIPIQQKNYNNFNENNIINKTNQIIKDKGYKEINLDINTYNDNKDLLSKIILAFGIKNIIKDINNAKK